MQQLQARAPQAQGRPKRDRAIRRVVSKRPLRTGAWQAADLPTPRGLRPPCAYSAAASPSPNGSSAPRAAPRAAGTTSLPPPPVSPGQVSVTVDSPPLASSSRLVAVTSVLAPPEAVWDRLTDYAALHKFIPGLVVNRCLERRARGARLYQVGAQDLAPGLRFTAACTLDLTEHLRGAPAAALASAGGVSAAAAAFPGASAAAFPGATVLDSAAMASGEDPQQQQQHPIHGDILFEAVAGDFEEFKGLWRVARGAAGPGSAHLWYVLTVRPQRWLPVGLVAGHIKNQVAQNVRAVAAASEARHRAVTAAAARAPPRA